MGWIFHLLSIAPARLDPKRSDSSHVYSYKELSSLPLLVGNNLLLFDDKVCSEMPLKQEAELPVGRDVKKRYKQ